jgi:hypothetical protein
MYCSGCGFALTPGQPVCPQCGRPLAPPVPPVPGLAYQVEIYSSKIKTLGIFWFAYAVFTLISGFVGLAILNSIFGHNHNWNNTPWGNGFLFGPVLMHFARVAIIARAALAIAAGWGLVERAPWGRFVALVAAFLTILKFPLGTALAIFTLVMLLGYRNTTLYGQLRQTPVAF